MSPSLNNYSVVLLLSVITFECIVKFCNWILIANRNTENKEEVMVKDKPLQSFQYQLIIWCDSYVVALYWWEGFANYVVAMSSSDIIRIPDSVTIILDIQILLNTLPQSIWGIVGNIGEIYLLVCRWDVFSPHNKLTQFLDVYLRHLVILRILPQQFQTL
jgi:hypothetical protein